MLNINKLYYSRNNGGSKNTILDDISLSLENRKIHALVGPNGCGKTTLVNLIAGYLKPESGTISYGDVIFGGPGRDRVVINQESDLFDWMTVRKNLELVSTDKALINYYTELLNLAPYTNYYPKELSGGLKKRVSIARSLIASPQIMILDEAFTFLDADSRKGLQTEILKIKKEIHSCILLITHDVREALYLADEVHLFSGPPLQLVDSIKNTVPSNERELLQFEAGLNAHPEKIKEIITAHKKM